MSEPAHGPSYHQLQRENTELRAKLDRYARISESGESLGGELEEREGRMELESKLAATEAKLADVRADQAECNEANETQAQRIADLEAKLKESEAKLELLRKDAVRSCGMLIYAAGGSVRVPDSIALREFEIRREIRPHEFATVWKAVRAKEEG